jgi:hypothetical protein
MKMLNAQELFESSKPKRVYSEADGEQFSQAEKALGENRLDVSGPGAHHNVALIDQFFQSHPNIPVSVANIYRAVEERKNEFVWLSQAQADWYRTSQQNPELANALLAYLSTQGQPTRLVKDGDAAFENLVLLFNELQGRRETASAVTIQNAENRIANRPGKQLTRVEKPRRTEPISPAAKNDDGVPFLGNDLVKCADGSYRSKTYAEQKRDAEAQEAAAAAAKAATKTGPSPEDAAWKRMADECLRYGTHANQYAIKQAFDQAVASGASWRRVFEACNRLVNEYKRRAAISGGVR